MVITKRWSSSKAPRGLESTSARLQSLATPSSRTVETFSLARALDALEPTRGNKVFFNVSHIKSLIGIWKYSSQRFLSKTSMYDWFFFSLRQFVGIVVSRQAKHIMYYIFSILLYNLHIALRIRYANGFRISLGQPWFCCMAGMFAIMRKKWAILWWGELHYCKLYRILISVNVTIYYDTIVKNIIVKRVTTLT